MKVSWQFTPAKVLLLYMCGVFVGIAIALWLTQGGGWGAVAVTLGMAFTTASAVLSCRGRAAETSPPIAGG